MEFSCYPSPDASYFGLSGHLEICKINAYSNKWHKVFDFNPVDAGAEKHWSLAEPYIGEKIKEVVDWGKCELYVYCLNIMFMSF